MSITTIEIPVKATRASREPKLTADELKTAIKLLKDGKPISDDVVYTTIPGKKRDPKTIAYDTGYAVRSEVAATNEFTLTDLKVRTWQDGEGYRWAVVVK